MSNPARTSSTRASSLRSYVEKHTLPCFFILVFALTWLLQIVDALGSHGLLPVRVPLVMQVLLVAYMPTLAAVIMAALTGGRTEVKDLLRKLLIWKVELRWYLAAVFIFAAICASAVLLTKQVTDATLPLLSGQVASAGWALLFMLPALFLVTTLINGEELAWRGFALPRLQTRWSAGTSSLLLGTVWIMFHLPMWLTYRGYPLDASAVLSWSVQLLGASVIFTWLFNNTRGSVLLAYLLHGSVNTWTRVFPIESAPPLTGWLITGFVCLTALGLIVSCGWEHLRRSGQRVAYQSSSTSSRA